MVGGVLSQLKPSELYILSCEKASAFGLGIFHSLKCRAPLALSYTYPTVTTTDGTASATACDYLR